MSSTDWFLLLLLLLVYVITRSWIVDAIERIAISKNTPMQRKLMIRQIMHVAHSALFIFLASVILGIDYGKFVVFMSSAFAILGVALFAQWSILSNLTAGVVIFFKFPYRIGDRIRIVNKDFDLTGMIEEITSFHVLIRHANGELITYPNNLILQTPVIKLSNTPDSTLQLNPADNEKKRPAIESD
ncbi:mechanosensitive ion channel domain-containing protein [Bowmanella sp. JS7-9]|uniref:Small-conductance mechanosensitive channel n=1 Tax=Pseudobowmanella zhangzhouensis TaxID=1537679 RepID=A0ABW1XN31_9ALTE|nr:mechanosensitive ion channel domain-containing protein [Bowmanella sp. JS7-9]TBX23057.1 mechanosensitive ion channel protein MscS [Bowmanella sp. JS7-9]